MRDVVKQLIESQAKKIELIMKDVVKQVDESEAKEIERLLWIHAEEDARQRYHPWRMVDRVMVTLENPKGGRPLVYEYEVDVMSTMCKHNKYCTEKFDFYFQEKIDADWAYRVWLSPPVGEEYGDQFRDIEFLIPIIQEDNSDDDMGNLPTGLEWGNPHNYPKIISIEVTSELDKPRTSKCKHQKNEDE